MNFALALTGGKIKAVKVDVGAAGGNDPQSAAGFDYRVSTLENVLLEADVSKQTHDSILTQIDAGAGSIAKQDNKAKQDHASQ